MADLDVRLAGKGPLRYVVEMSDGDRALVAQRLFGKNYIFHCFYCRKSPTTCDHVAAVRGYRRQGYLEDDA